MNILFDIIQDYDACSLILRYMEEFEKVYCRQEALMYMDVYGYDIPDLVYFIAAVEHWVFDEYIVIIDHSIACVNLCHPRADGLIIDCIYIHAYEEGEGYDQGIHDFYEYTAKTWNQFSIHAGTL